MIYAFVDAAGVIVQQVETGSMVIIERYKSTIKHACAIEIDSYQNPREVRYKDGEWVALDIDDPEVQKAQPATKELIDKVRDELDLEPVMVDGMLLAVDQQSEQRMANYVLGEIGANWRCADGVTVSLSPEGMASALKGMRRERALRSERLFNTARGFKDRLSNLSVYDIRPFAWR